MSRQHMNFPDRFGFEPDLRNCVGKTIERVEQLAMEYGCTWQRAFAVRFTDSTRAFFAGQPGTGIMNPVIAGEEKWGSHTVESSEIFTRQELATMWEAKQQQVISRARVSERQEREQYERLAAKYANKRQS